MRAIVATFFGCLLSTAAFASASVTLTPIPQSPVVMEADSTHAGKNGPHTVRSPWFQTEYQVTTDQLITIVGIQQTVIAPDGTTQTRFKQLRHPVEIPAGATYNSRVYFNSVSEMPAQRSWNFKVETRLIGWLGDNTSNGPSLHATTTFQTQ